VNAGRTLGTVLAAAIVLLTVTGVAAAATAPAATTSAASSVAATSATLNGTVNPNGEATTWYFEYGTNTHYGTKTSTQNAGSGTTAVTVSAPLSGLKTGQLYHFRLVATSAVGTGRGADQTFTTVALPSVTTGSASSVTASSAKLTGSIVPNGQATTWYFEYGTSTSYGSKTSVGNAGSGSKTTNVSSSISGLSGGTTYHFRLDATNGSGQTFGSDQSFTTVAGAPTVQTGAAQSVGASTATLTGSVNPQGHSTSWWFEYGTTTGYGSRTSSKGAGSGTASVSVSAAVSKLAAVTTYHYRLVASSSAGKSLGADATFTTAGAVTLKAAALKVVYGRYVTLSGAVSSKQAGVKVTVLAQEFGANSFTTLTTVLTGSGGAWTYLARPKIRTSYEASAEGGTSPAVTVGVRPAVTLRVISKARFSSRVTARSSLAGHFVQLQRLSGSRWVTVKRTRLNSSSLAIFRASLLPHGRSTIRVAMSVNQAGPGYLAGFSRTLVYRRG
jgi:hypothetical protein